MVTWLFRAGTNERFPGEGRAEAFEWKCGRATDSTQGLCNPSRVTPVTPADIVKLNDCRRLGGLLEQGGR